MRRTGLRNLFILTWILPAAGLPAFASVSVCSAVIAQSISERACAEGSSLSGSRQDSQQAPSSSGGAPTSQAPGQRPHLIELTAANWRPLAPKEKFELFWRDPLSWGVHLSLAVDAAISLATDDREYMGEGTSGFARRYAFNLADEANVTFVQAFLLPTIFHEDPRYIPLEKGSKKARTAYALSRVLVARRDSGEFGFNVSKLLGTFVSSAASNFYTPPGRNSSSAATFTRGAINLGSDAAFNIFKEFWPDFARRFKVNIWIQNIIRSSIRDVIRVD